MKDRMGRLIEHVAAFYLNIRPLRAVCAEKAPKGCRNILKPQLWEDYHGNIQM